MNFGRSSFARAASCMIMHTFKCKSLWNLSFQSYELEIFYQARERYLPAHSSVIWDIHLSATATLTSFIVWLFWIIDLTPGQAYLKRRKDFAEKETSNRLNYDYDLCSWKNTYSQVSFNTVRITWFVEHQFDNLKH